MKIQHILDYGINKDNKTMERAKILMQLLGIEQQVQAQARRSPRNSMSDITTRRLGCPAKHGTNVHCNTGKSSREGRILLFNQSSTSASYRKKVTKLVPYILPEFYRTQRVFMSSLRLAGLTNEPFVNGIVTGYEKWLFDKHFKSRRHWVSKKITTGT